MNTTEFSLQFDIYYNSIASNQAPPVDEYEKSVFLTNAQRDLIVDIYSGRIKVMSFESTEEARRYLAPLVVNMKYEDLVRDENISYRPYKLFQREVEVEGQPSTEDYFPKDICYIVMEYANLSGDECLKDERIEVIPITHDELLRTLKNPFRGMTDRRVLRVDENNLLYLYSKKDLKSYNIVYVKNPSPIIVADLSVYGQQATVDGIQAVTECQLPEIFHREILNRAVLAAKQAYTNVQQSNS